jgi:hypothetical protein
MKLFFSEFKADYSKYHFPYQVWLLKEEGDSQEQLYSSGFLPMRNIPNVYYLSRSVRVGLKGFEISSENRRILKKTENFNSRLFALNEFEYGPRVQKMCKDYANQRLRGIITSASIKNIFSGKVYSHVFVFENKKNREEAGFAVVRITEKIIQYGHSFYDLSYLSDNLGARMMLEAVIWAKENQKSHIYLGTCYSQNALYKTEFKGVEFFNGFEWSSDLEELKYLVRRESEEYLLKDQEYLEKFHENDFHRILDKKGIRVKL